jgi:tungstate transport system substrate-binding protein
MKRVHFASRAAAVVLCVGLHTASAPSAALQTRPIRLAMVNVPDDVIRPLLPAFSSQSGQQAQIVYTGNDPFTVARDGKADLVIAHYGHEGVAPFVTGGFGLWPHPVFANQIALIGPPSDPAHVRGLTDAAEAMRRIAASQSRFVVNNSAGNRYVEDILLTRAGNPAKGSWYVDLHSQGPQAARDAAKEGAYTLWGVPPFLRLKRQSAVNLEPLVTADSIFQRIMVAIVVNPQKISGVNDSGADAFQAFLLTPSINRSGGRPAVTTTRRNRAARDCGGTASSRGSSSRGYQRWR